jgi:hypothetical protein
MAAFILPTSRIAAPDTPRLSSALALPDHVHEFDAGKRDRG